MGCSALDGGIAMRLLALLSVPSECEIDCLRVSDLSLCWHAVCGVPVYDSNCTIHWELESLWNN